MANPCLPIQALFARRSPPAIARLVVAVVVDAVDGCIRWALAHVGEETGKIHPSVADRDPSTTVSVIPAILGIGATVNHSTPRRVCSSAALPVGTHFRPCHFGAEAPTRTSSAIANMLAVGFKNSAAVAAKLPSTLPKRISTHVLKGDDPAESLTSNVKAC